MLANPPMPLPSVTAAVSASLPALALVSVPLLVLPSVSVSPLTRPDSTPVPVRVSRVLPL